MMHGQKNIKLLVQFALRFACFKPFGSSSNAI